MQVIRLGAHNWVNPHIINHHRVVDLAADALGRDFVDLAHSLPAAADVLHFGFGHFEEFRFADVVARLYAETWRPSVLHFGDHSDAVPLQLLG